MDASPPAAGQAGVKAATSSSTIFQAGGRCGLARLRPSSAIRSRSSRSKRKTPSSRRRRVDIAGHGEIEQQHRPLPAALQRRLHHRRADQPACRRRWLQSARRPRPAPAPSRPRAAYGRPGDGVSRAARLGLVQHRDPASSRASRNCSMISSPMSPSPSSGRRSCRAGHGPGARSCSTAAASETGRSPSAVSLRTRLAAWKAA